MDHNNSLEQRITLQPLDKLQWIPVFGYIRSHTVPQERSIRTHAKYHRSELGDLWAGYQLVSSLAALGGLYYLVDKYVW